MKVQVCTWKMCSERFSSYIIERLEKDKDFFKLENLQVESCMCTGNCKNGPVALFDGDIQLRTNPIQASEIARWKKQVQKLESNTKPRK